MHSGNAAFDQTIRTTFSNATFDQTIRTTFSNAAFDQTIRTTFSNATFDQTIRTTFSNAAFDQTIRATFSHTAFDQFVRAAFGNHGVGRGGGESVDSEDRESDAEKGLAFHDDVLRGVVGWYGTDVTPEIFYENFIAVMVNIDADDGCQKPQIRASQHLHCTPDRLNRPGRFADWRAIGALKCQLEQLIGLQRR